MRTAPDQVAARTPDQRWLAYADPVAARVRNLANRFAKHVRTLTADNADGRGYHALALSAVFEAYADLGGDPAEPDAFDWAGQHDTLVFDAVRRLKRHMTGRGSLYQDIERRTAPRTEVVNVTANWSQWEYAIVDRRYPTDKPRLDTGFGTHAGQVNGEAALDVQLRRDDLRGLYDELRAVLTANEFRWLVARFADGIGSQELVDQLVAEEPLRYGGPKGRARAENRINVTVARAKQKAATALRGRARDGAPWVAYLREIA